MDEADAEKSKLYVDEGGLVEYCVIKYVYFIST